MQIEPIFPQAIIGLNKLKIDHNKVLKYLEGIECSTREIIKVPARHTGIIIDWKDGFSRYPQEHKPLNLIELDNGQFALYPNNYLCFKDAHFISEEAKNNLKFYKRNEKLYWGS